MKNILAFSVILLSLAACKGRINSKAEPKTAHQVTQVAEFKGQQVTGIAIANSGRMFVNFPRWREGVESAVVEIDGNKNKSYPNQEWNSWEIGQPVVADKFIAVQSVLAHDDKLYVLDTRNPQFKTVLDAPRVFVFDLKSNTLTATYILEKNSFHPDSYINDLRVDGDKIYFTDSGHAGLVVYNIATGTSKRILNDHFSTSAEVAYLTFAGTQWKRSVHSDGIELDVKNQRLLYHALTGYSLYSIPTASFDLDNKTEIEKTVRLESKTAAPDGMIFDNKGFLYYADLEKNKIDYRKPDGTIHTLIEGVDVRWADSFSIYKDDLYYTNSRINEVTGPIDEMVFTINKIKLPLN
ncbi:hypothetical protein FFWV33_17185 [Flavobacterium faecale]|uniref:Major royal jelly protein n=1 Tax=Flavobacterium faecale TaxID=1355330 RepID=A0A2S1LHF8_9FLAO|nr:L-dopachrome tautomerase-related protein [Flavobacterium faecale]AWG23138.1 hypothetical protein FFWV33_17185 [Flavobacterium faecale]